MTGAVLIALVSHWRRNRLQLLALLLGLALATSLWTGVQAINAEARASYAEAAATLAEDRLDQLLPRAGDLMAEEVFVTLRRAGWLVSPVIEGRLPLADGSIRLIGVDPLTAPPGSTARNALEGLELATLLREQALLAEPETAALLAEHLPNPVQADTGIMPGLVLADIGTAQRLLGRQGRLSRLVVLPNQPLRQAQLVEVAPELMLQPADKTSDLGRLTDSFHLNLAAFGFLSFAVGIFIVNGTIGLAFEQRRALVRTLRALGVPLRRLVFLLVLEIVMLALLAGGCGILLGYFIATLLMPDVAATVRGLYGADLGDRLAIRLSWWGSGLAMALVGALLAAAGALWQLARMPVLQGAGRRAWVLSSGRTHRLLLAAAMVFFGVAGMLGMFASGLIAGFALLGFLLLGAALALPACLSLLLQFGEARARRVMTQWFWADTRQQLPGLGLALMALLLAMATNVGVSTMVSSFRLTFTGFLDQRLAAELYVDVAGLENRARLGQFLEERAESLLPSLSMESTIAGQPAEIDGVRVGRTHRENWRFLDASPDAWDAVAAGTGTLINEQLARRTGIGIGEELVLTPELALPVVGIVGDYGNPLGQAVIGETLFASVFTDVAPTRYGIRTDDPDAMRQALVTELGLAPERISDQAAIKAFSLSIFERTFTVTAALNVLTLAVAAFAILMSLLTLAAMRLPQMAPVWAMGITQRQLARMEVMRALMLAGITSLLALPLGLALAWVLLAIVNVEAFGWRLPMFLFPGDYARLLLLALVAAWVAALWPAWRLASMQPAVLLRIFASER